MFDDARKEGWGDWGWGGPSVWDSAEKVRQGDKAAKKTYNCSNDAIRMHNEAALSTAAYTDIVFSAYGGPGTGGKNINVVINEKYDAAYQFSVVEGEWTTNTIPLSDVGSTATISDVLFQSAGWAGVVHYDHIGFK